MITATVLFHEDWKPDMLQGYYRLLVCCIEYTNYEESEPDCRRYSIDYRMLGDPKWLPGSGCALSVDRCLRDTAGHLWRQGDIDKNTAIQFIWVEDR